jgi:hypothetical protein
VENRLGWRLGRHLNRRARFFLVPVAILALLAGGTPPAAASLPTVNDSWTTSAVLRTSDGWYASPIQATLLPDGKDVLFIGIARNQDPPTSSSVARREAWVMPIDALGAAMPSTVVIRELAEPVDYPGVQIGDTYYSDDLFCSGQTLTADGRVVIAGGTRVVRTISSGAMTVSGLPYQLVFDGTSLLRVPGSMAATGPLGDRDRWYPTVTRLPSGVLLVTSGYEQVSPYPTPTGTIETLDPTTGARTVVTTTAPPQIVNRDYTHVFVLPYPTAAGQDVLMIGEAGQPIETSTSNLGALTLLPFGRPGYTTVGTNWGTSSTMLPILFKNGSWGYNNGAVLTASGNMGSQWEHNAAVFDPIAGKYLGAFDLVVDRHHPDAVDLPDGRILLINGHDMGGDMRVEQAEYIDPATHFSLSIGSSAEAQVRGYHSIALLLPDGRVLVGGGRDQDTDTSLEKPTYQYYLPDYMTKPRPAITSAPTSVAYGATFGVTSTGATPGAVVLVGLGSQTHSFDSDQRYVQLPISSITTSNGTSTVVAGSPANSHIAPPGYYMLFVLDTHRVPSVAKIVHIG